MSLITCAKGGEQFEPPSSYENCLQDVIMRDPTTGAARPFSLPICPACYASAESSLVNAFPNSPQALALQAAALQADATAVTAKAKLAADQIAAALNPPVTTTAAPT